jgi:hypothetical protein
MSVAGKRSSGGYASLGTTASAARTAFDELTVESFIWETTMCAADAAAPKLPYPLEGRLPVRNIKPLARSKGHCRWRGTPPPHDADCGSRWRFLGLRACAPPRILEGVDIWLIDGLLTQRLYRNGCIS